MDVHMLKEIDLVAFGRRVRVYNGIKELRQRTQQGNLMASVSYASGFTSPSVNGFDHTEGPLASPYTPSKLATSRSGAEEPRRWTSSAVPTDVPGARLAGLGLPEELTPAETVKQVRAFPTRVRTLPC